MAIVTHDSLAHLERLLDGQLAVARALGMRVAIVDNASSDGSAEYLHVRENEADDLEVSFQSHNLGYAGAVNIAFELLAPDDVMLINPDVQPTRDSVAALSRFMAADPLVGVCGPRLRFLDDRLQPSARLPASLTAMIGSLGYGDWFPPFRRSYERYLSPAGAGKEDVDWVIGAAMLIRRRAIAEVGGFDPGFFLYMEDADYCRRCADAGWRVCYVSEASMKHEYSRASSAHDASILSSRARRTHVASLLRYWRKHPGALVGREAGWG